MARPPKKTESSALAPPPTRVPTTPQEVERINMGLAAELASKQLRDGTASAQVQVHYLKMGTAEHELQLEKLKGEIKLQEARVHAIESAEKMAEMFEGAITAMVKYTGGDPTAVNVNDLVQPPELGEGGPVEPPPNV